MWDLRRKQKFNYKEIPDDDVDPDDPVELSDLTAESSPESDLDYDYDSDSKNEVAGEKVSSKSEIKKRDLTDSSPKISVKIGPLKSTTSKTSESTLARSPAFVGITNLSSERDEKHHGVPLIKLDDQFSACEVSSFDLEACSDDSDQNEEDVEVLPSLSLGNIQQSLSDLRMSAAIEETQLIMKTEDALLSHVVVDFIVNLEDDQSNKKCLKCPYKTPSVNRMIAHVIKHKVWICRFCCKSFINFKLFYCHIQEHTCEFGYYCSLCFVSRLKSGVLSHIHSTHKKSDGAVIKECRIEVVNDMLYGYLCLDCGTVKLTRELYDHHNQKCKNSKATKIIMSKLIHRKALDPKFNTKIKQALAVIEKVKKRRQMKEAIKYRMVLQRDDTDKGNMTNKALPVSDMKSMVYTNENKNAKVVTSSESNSPKIDASTPDTATHSTLKIAKVEEVVDGSNPKRGSLAAPLVTSTPNGSENSFVSILGSKLLEKKAEIQNHNLASVTSQKQGNVQMKATANCPQKLTQSLQKPLVEQVAPAASRLNPVNTPAFSQILHSSGRSVVTEPLDSKMLQKCSGTQNTTVIMVPAENVQHIVNTNHSSGTNVVVLPPTPHVFKSNLPSTVPASSGANVVVLSPTQHAFNPNLSSTAPASSGANVLVFPPTQHAFDPSLPSIAPASSGTNVVVLPPTSVNSGQLQQANVINIQNSPLYLSPQAQLLSYPLSVSSTELQNTQIKHALYNNSVVQPQNLVESLVGKSQSAHSVSKSSAVITLDDDSGQFKSEEGFVVPAGYQQSLSGPSVMGDTKRKMLASDLITVPEDGSIATNTQIEHATSNYSAVQPQNDQVESPVDKCQSAHSVSKSSAVITLDDDDSDQFKPEDSFVAQAGCQQSLSGPSVKMANTERMSESRVVTSSEDTSSIMSTTQMMTTESPSDDIELIAVSSNGKYFNNLPESNAVSVKSDVLTPLTKSGNGSLLPVPNKEKMRQYFGPPGAIPSNEAVCNAPSAFETTKNMTQTSCDETEKPSDISTKSKPIGTSRTLDNSPNSLVSPNNSNMDSKVVSISNPNEGMLNGVMTSRDSIATGPTKTLHSNSLLETSKKDVCTVHLNSNMKSDELQSRASFKTSLKVDNSDELKSKNSSLHRKRPALSNDSKGELFDELSHPTPAKKMAESTSNISTSTESAVISSNIKLVDLNKTGNSILLPKKLDNTVDIQCPKCKVMQHFTQSSLTLHLLQHYDLNCYGCGLCDEDLKDESSINKHALAKHQRSVIPYRISRCPEFIKTMVSEAFAKRKPSRKGNQALSKGKMMKCSMCTTFCKSGNSLRCHLKSCHFFPFKCDLCGDLFGYPSFLKQHYSNQHGRKLSQPVLNPKYDREQFQKAVAGIIDAHKNDPFNDFSQKRVAAKSQSQKGKPSGRRTEKENLASLKSVNVTAVEGMGDVISVPFSELRKRLPDCRVLVQRLSCDLDHNFRAQ